MASRLIPLPADDAPTSFGGAFGNGVAANADGTFTAPGGAHYAHLSDALAGLKQAAATRASTYRYFDPATGRVITQAVPLDLSTNAVDPPY